MGQVGWVVTGVWRMSPPRKPAAPVLGCDFFNVVDGVGREICLQENFGHVGLIFLNAQSLVELVS